MSLYQTYQDAYFKVRRATSPLHRENRILHPEIFEQIDRKQATINWQRDVVDQDRILHYAHEGEPLSVCGTAVVALHELFPLPRHTHIPCILCAIELGHET